MQEGQDYLFFPKAYYAGGITTSEVCVVCTPRYVFALPSKDYKTYLVAVRTVKHNYFGEGVRLQDGVKKMLAEEGLTVRELEERLVELVGDGKDVKDRVFKIDELAKFNISAMPIIGQCRMKHASGGGTKVVSCKGKGAMKQFKAFYEGATSS